MTFAIITEPSGFASKWLPFQTAKRHVTNVKKLAKMFALRRNLLYVHFFGIFCQICAILILFHLYHIDDDNESCKRRNETKELENILRKKEDTLRKLKLVKMYRAKVTAYMHGSKNIPCFSGLACPKPVYNTARNASVAARLVT